MAITPPITFQFWNDQSFQSYALPQQQLLCQSLLQTPRPNEVVMSQSPYVISHFNKVEHGGALQTNTKTGFQRWIRIQPPYVLPGVAALVPPREIHFCFEDGRDGSQLVPFAEELQADLKNFLASSPRPSEVYFQVQGTPYLLSGMDQIQDVSSDAPLAQVNLKTGFMRRVRIMQGRVPRAVPSRPSYRGASSSHGSLGFAGLPASSSGKGFGKRSFDPPTPARASPFSLSSVAFCVTANGRRERLDEKTARLLLRQWTATERPSQVDLGNGTIVENFEGLEQGLATVRQTSSSRRSRLELKIPAPMPGSLSLPADLEEGEALDIMSTGKALTDQEISKLVGDDGQCPICMDSMEPSQPQVLLDEDGDVEMQEEGSSRATNAPLVSGVFRLRCGHAYHMTCLRTWFQQKTRCPSCQQEFGKVVGKQPRIGSFSWHCEDFPLPGHPDAVKTVVIQFVFPEGTDDEGNSYGGRKPKGYLPCNAQGIILLELFKVAFRRRVMFGMGESMTFSSYRPTFNIHIKTSSTGGETKHGYPDATYFQRSLSELKANGVNLMDLRS